jgi:predicted transcriptional regulator
MSRHTLTAWSRLHRLFIMAAIKISSKVEEEAWRALQRLAKESQRSISGLLTEAVESYVKRHTVRTEVMDHLERSMDRNAELGRLLAE